MNRVLVTGANGFLGTRVVQECQRAGFTVRACGRSPASDPKLQDWRVADLRIQDEVIPLMENVQCVVHSAGLAHQFGKTRHDNGAFYENNVRATSNVVRAAAAAGVSHFILVSSVAVYGGGSGLISEQGPCHPRDPYGASKLQAEEQARGFAKTAGLPLTILRFATMYGENDPGNIVRLIRAIDSGRFIWIGRGTNLKSLIHVEDAARACVRVLCQPPPRSGVCIYNVASPPVRIRQIVERLEAALHKRVPSIHIPASLPLTLLWAISRLTFGHGVPRHWHSVVCKWLGNDAYDSTRFGNDFDFETTIPLDVGLAREVSWYRRAA